MNVLGIDGGGSKTVFLLEDDAGSTIARTESGPSNWLSAGADAARHALQSGISRLPQKPDIVCAGFAGAGRAEGLAFYKECLQALLPNVRILIETDAAIAYAGAIGIQPGVLLIAGTGSIAISRTHDGLMCRFGGWGPMFGDEGSGFWIGREMVRAALLDHDRGEDSEIVRLVTRELGKASVPDVITAWGKGELDTAAVARLATPLFRHYPQAPAEDILKRAAAHLRDLAMNAIQRSNLSDSCPKAVAGSVASHPLMQELTGLRFTTPKEPPERGAISLARARIKPS